MPVPVMRIRHMRMGVAQRVVAMGVTVRTHGHRLVCVAVVSVVVPVCMFVLQRLVIMLVAV